MGACLVSCVYPYPSERNRTVRSASPHFGNASIRRNGSINLPEIHRFVCVTARVNDRLGIRPEKLLFTSVKERKRQDGIPVESLTLGVDIANNSNDKEKMR